MITLEEIDFYKKFKDLKKAKSLKWPAFGDIVGKSEATIRMAFKNKSLREDEKQKIENHFYPNENPSLEVVNSGLLGLSPAIFESEDDMNSLTRFFIKYAKELANDPMMGKVIRDYKKKGENDFLRLATERLKNDSSEKASWVREYLLSLKIESSDS